MPSLWRFNNLYFKLCWAELHTYQLFFSFFFWLHSLWDLSSLTRDWTREPWQWKQGVLSLDGHWIPKSFILEESFEFFFWELSGVCLCVCVCVCVCVACPCAIFLFCSLYFYSLSIFKDLCYISDNTLWLRIKLQIYFPN